MRALVLAPAACAPAPDERAEFRSVGQDFVLHIYCDDRITLSWDGGAQETFPAPAPLRVEIRRYLPGVDGEQPDGATVRVEIDGVAHSGCGRSL